MTKFSILAYSKILLHQLKTYTGFFQENGVWLNTSGWSSVTMVKYGQFAQGLKATKYTEQL